MAGKEERVFRTAEEMKEHYSRGSSRSARYHLSKKFDGKASLSSRGEKRAIPAQSIPQQSRADIPAVVVPHSSRMTDRDDGMMINHIILIWIRFGAVFICAFFFFFFF